MFCLYILLDQLMICSFCVTLQFPWPEPSNKYLCLGDLFCDFHFYSWLGTVLVLDWEYAGEFCFLCDKAVNYVVSNFIFRLQRYACYSSLEFCKCEIGQYTKGIAKLGL